MRIHLGDIPVEVVQKDIKHIHLSVHPPQGRVRIAAPLRMDIDTIRVFAIAKLGWIRQQQQKLRAQPRQAPMEYLDRESHYLWGKRYLLKIVEMDAPPQVTRRHSTLLLQVRPGSNTLRKQTILAEWYRQLLKDAASPLLAQWAAYMKVPTPTLTVRAMRTKWGSCTPAVQSIRLNIELAKKPRECLEYIVVHELTHLLEPTHNARFIALLDGLMPHWRLHRDELNRLPVRHEEWDY